MTKNQKDYNPTPVYNRKWARTVLRNQIINRYGYHKVNTIMSEAFKRIRNKSAEEVEE